MFAGETVNYMLSEPMYVLDCSNVWSTDYVRTDLIRAVDNFCIQYSTLYEYHGFHDEEETIQIQRSVESRRFDCGAIPKCCTIC